MCSHSLVEWLRRVLFFALHHQEKCSRRLRKMRRSNKRCARASDALLRVHHWLFYVLRLNRSELA
jgi:hypothetical protein